MQILDIEQKTGLDRATIRFYEKENLVIPKRESNGYRVYSEDDLQHLLKIKLLRQLGFPLSKIKSLQQGSGDFSVVLQEQIRSLEQRIVDDTKAKKVCLEMQRAGVAYSNLDAQLYLTMLQSPIGMPKLYYQEPVNKESNPIRRYIARSLDVSLLAAVVNLLIIVVFRIRPVSNLLIIVIGLLSYIAIIPIEAAMLHFWSTTPGKWAMGIRLENINGGRLSYNDAFIRGMYIIRYGYGFGIPIWDLWRLYKSYQEEGDNPWNEETEIIYEDWTAIRKVSIIALLVMNFTLDVLCGADAVLPPYRGDLTIWEFTKNYQMYETMLGYGDNYYSMAPNGTWVTGVRSGSITITEPSGHARKEFFYNYDDGTITGIHFEDTWQNPNFMDALPYYCRCATLAFAASRPGCTHKDLIRLEEEIETELHEGLSSQHNENSYSGTIDIEDVRITWKINLSNIDTVYNGILFSEEDTPSSYTLSFDIYTVK